MTSTDIDSRMPDAGVAFGSDNERALPAPSLEKSSHVPGLSNRRYGKLIQVIVRPEAYALLAKWADAESRTISGYVRKVLALETAKVTRLPAEGTLSRAAIAALNQLGNNLNQIAKTGNASGTLNERQIASLGAALRHLKVLVTQLREPKP